jgi:hypothetical protein
MANTPSQQAPQSTIVTISDGATTTKAIQDASGRIITATQVTQIRDGQQLELDKVTAIRDQLVAGEASAVDLIINQARDEFQRRLAVLDLQKADLNASLQKLKDGEVSLRQEIIQKMTDRLGARIDLMTGSRDRSNKILDQLQTAVAGDAAPVLAPNTATAPKAPAAPEGAASTESPG